MKEFADAVQVTCAADTNMFPWIQVLHKAATLRFEYTPIKQAQANEAAGFTAGAQQVKLHIPNMEKLTEPEHTILAELMQRFSVPAAVRCDICMPLSLLQNTYVLLDHLCSKFDRCHWLSFS